MKTTALIVVLALVATATAVPQRRRTTTTPAPVSSTAGGTTAKPHLVPEGVSRQGCKGALDAVTDDDINRIINNQRLFDFYVKCLLEDDLKQVKCTCGGWELRKIMSGLLQPNLCPENTTLPYCPTVSQRQRGQEFMKNVSKVDQDAWKKVLKKYAGKGSN